MTSITAFGALFAALGCKMNYNSKKVRLEVIEAPKGGSVIVENATSDIDHFDDTVNYVDGAAALVLAETIDGNKNPLSVTIRKNVLDGLAITKDDKFIYQALSLQKNNRAWHFSDVPNDCSHFGETCTHRGIKPDPERKGRRSNRKPEEYHRLDGHGKIGREQLVTPALEKLFQSIPQRNLVSGREFMTIHLDLKNLTKMPLDKKIQIITELQESMT